MTPDLIGEAVSCGIIFAGFVVVLGVGCFIADYIFPRIPFIQRRLDTLPDWDEEEEW